jgi:hypothetical protein
MGTFIYEVQLIFSIGTIQNNDQMLINIRLLNEHGEENGVRRINIEKVATV